MSHWKLDADRLVSDDGYSIWVAGKLLFYLRKQFGKLEPFDWMGRYHNARPKPRALYMEKLRQAGYTTYPAEACFEPVLECL